MATGLRKPGILSFEGNCAENWRIFELEYSIYVNAAHATANARTKSYIFIEFGRARSY